MTDCSRLLVKSLRGNDTPVPDIMVSLGEGCEFTMIRGLVSRLLSSEMSSTSVMVFDASRTGELVIRGLALDFTLGVQSGFIRYSEFNFLNSSLIVSLIFFI